MSDRNLNMRKIVEANRMHSLKFRYEYSRPLEEE